jgi:radical SAM superfamily enzyme YgiQ (UPF0313 family)
MQLGIQHTDDTILKRINRGCTTADAKRAIRLLKDACYKIDIHLMPNLPGASPEIDRRMFQCVSTVNCLILPASEWSFIVRLLYTLQASIGRSWLTGGPVENLPLRDSAMDRSQKMV